MGIIIVLSYRVIVRTKWKNTVKHLTWYLPHSSLVNVSEDEYL